MRWKIFTLIAGLTLMVTTSAPPSKVEAQGLVEYALILVVVAIGPDERLELYLPGSNVPMPPPQGSTPLIIGTIQPTGALPGGPICSSQTVQFTVPTTPGRIKILNVYRGEDYLMINGKEVGEALSECNKKATRVLLTFSVPGPPPSNDGQVPVVPPDEPRVGLPNLARVLGYSIVNLTSHKTVASGGATNSITFFDSQGRETSN
jgi:hypothetical protein